MSVDVIGHSQQSDAPSVHYSAQCAKWYLKHRERVMEDYGLLDITYG